MRLDHEEWCGCGQAEGQRRCERGPEWRHAESRAGGECHSSAKEEEEESGESEVAHAT